MRSPWNPESPELLPAIVCYADILGFREMTERAFIRGRARARLRRIKRSLAAAYDEVREFATRAGTGGPLFDMKVFTDNIVVAHPLGDPRSDLGEPELGTMLVLFADLQAKLAADGFFLRGAITVGMHYQDRDIAYGRALLEAVDLDKSGGPPRLVIGPSLEPLIAEQLSWYSGPSPHSRLLLEDPCDDRLFVNYLGVAFEHFPDDPIDQALLSAHRKRVRKGLRAFGSGSRVRAKYRWAAIYHNCVCRRFADQHPVRCDEGADLEDEAFGAQAQRALDHLVRLKVQPEEQSPRPLDAQRLRGRVAET